MGLLAGNTAVNVNTTLLLLSCFVNVVECGSELVPLGENTTVLFLFVIFSLNSNNSDIMILII